MEQRELRRVGSQIKHALARERAARVNAVDAADKLFVLPSLYAVCVPLSVQLRLAADQRGRYPSSVLVRPLNIRARTNHALERAVKREAQDRAPTLACEAARDVQ